MIGRHSSTKHFNKFSNKIFLWIRAWPRSPTSRNSQKFRPRILETLTPTPPKKSGSGLVRLYFRLSKYIFLQNFQRLYGGRQVPSAVHLHVRVCRPSSPRFDAPPIRQHVLDGLHHQFIDNISTRVQQTPTPTFRGCCFRDRSFLAVRGHLLLGS